MVDPSPPSKVSDPFRPRKEPSRDRDHEGAGRPRARAVRDPGCPGARARPHGGALPGARRLHLWDGLTISSPVTTRGSGRRPSLSSRGTSGPGDRRLAAPRRPAGRSCCTRRGTSHDACGVCQQCVEGRYNLCENYCVGMASSTASTATPTRVPTPSTSCTVKCGFPAARCRELRGGCRHLPASIALHVANPARIAPGDNVAIMGGGAIGLLGGEAAKDPRCRSRHHRRTAGRAPSEGVGHGIRGHRFRTG